MPVSFVSFPQGEVEQKDFNLVIEGTRIPLHQARVSAMPFNRRWPGHQRELDQTELASFASFTIDGPVTVLVTPKREFKNVVIRPLSKKISFQRNGSTLTFQLPGPGFYTVELDGVHGALHLFAEGPKEYSVVQGQENVIFYGPGVYHPGIIQLSSGQTLYLAEGAVVYGSIQAKHADNIRILGRGILDNSENKEEILYPVETSNGEVAVNNAIRTHTVQLEYCKNVEIDGITIRDSLVYNIRPICCETLRISDVKIIGNWRYNTDGIDMHNCYDTVIRHCFIRTFDDSICVKGFDYTQNPEELRSLNARQSRFENILVEDCVIWCDWGRALEIGAETRADEICNVTFQNCDVIHVVHGALDVQNVDYARVHDITYHDIRVECDGVQQTPGFQSSDEMSYQENPNSTYLPLLMSASVFFHPEYCVGSPERGENYHITFSDIQVTSDQMPKSRFWGYDQHHQTRDITIERLSFNGNPICDWEEANIEVGEFASNVQLKP